MSAARSSNKRKRLDYLFPHEKETDRSVSLQHVTSLSLFDTFIAEDKTNLTPTSRNVQKYDIQLSLNEDERLVESILQLSKTLGRKVHLLDAGCGEAVMIDELLSDPDLKDALGSCTGVSLHYFSNVKNVMQKHGDRFQYYHGHVQDHLEKLSQCYDMIVDMAGAYVYTVDRLQLLRLYHQALQPKASAYIFICSPKTLMTWKNDKAVSLIDKLCHDHSDTFERETLHSNYEARLKLTKASERFPLPPYQVSFYELKPTISIIQAEDKSSDELAQGNALYPSNVFVEPQFGVRGLRRLNFK